MKKTIFALTGAAVLLGAVAASAQTYYHYNHDHYASRDRDHHWDRDHRWRDRAHYSSWRYGYTYGPARECQWRFGREVCWYRY